MGSAPPVRDRWQELALPRQRPPHGDTRGHEAWTGTGGAVTPLGSGHAPTRSPGPLTAPQPIPPSLDSSHGQDPPRSLKRGECIADSGSGTEWPLHGYVAGTKPHGDVRAFRKQTTRSPRLKPRRRRG